MIATPLDKLDMNQIHALDFKCYDYAIEAQDYKKLLKKGTALSTLVYAGEKRAGFAIWERGAQDGAAHFIRFGILPAFRNQGLGRKLLGLVLADLQRVKKNTVRSVLSQATCLGPNDPDDVSGFMLKVGFRWAESVEDAFFNYGEYYDGFVFERKV